MSTLNVQNKGDKVNKRKLSPHSPSKNIISTSTKRNKTTELSASEMEEFKKMIESSMANVSKQIKETQNTLNDKISSLGNDIRDDMKSQINSIQNSLSTFSSNVNNEIGSMRNELNKHSDHRSIHDDDISRITLMNQLRISGIQSTPNENLLSIFKGISNEIKYNIDDPISIPHMRRIINRKNGTMAVTNTIIMYFNGNHHKENFYGLYLRNVPFKKDFLDTMKCSKIIIGEHLTKTNASLFSKCLALKKNNILAQTYTSNGIVYVKSIKGKTEPAFMIRTEKDLQHFIDNINYQTDILNQNISNDDIGVNNGTQTSNNMNLVQTNSIGSINNTQSTDQRRNHPT